MQRASQTKQDGELNQRTEHPNKTDSFLYKGTGSFSNEPMWRRLSSSYPLQSSGNSFQLGELSKEGEGHNNWSVCLAFIN